MARTSITVSKDFREQLEGLRLADETMEQMLKRVIVGTKKQIDQFDEPIAFDLQQYDIDSDKNEYLEIYWSQLLSSREGDIFDFMNKPKNCISEIAEVLIREKDFILVEFKTVNFKNNKYSSSSFKFVCFNIFH